jgi:hypothetical protein
MTYHTEVSKSDLVETFFKKWLVSRAAIQEITLEDHTFVLFDLVRRQMEECNQLSWRGTNKLNLTDFDGNFYIVVSTNWWKSAMNIISLLTERKSNYTCWKLNSRLRWCLLWDQWTKRCLMKWIERVQHILVGIHNSLQVSEFPRWEAFRDQIIKIT